MADLPRVGETFDRYRIDSQVGFGGMGVVFAATDLRLGRQVALKVIAAQLTANDEFRQRFEREAEIMARLDSPHVLTIFDHGVHEGTPWLSTQLVSGGDLGSRLREPEPLSLSTAAVISAQVADALGDAHRAGVVHRDVKPSNVLLRGESLEPHAYLCDFGIAHNGAAGLTATGGVAGSWAYIAPERTSGDPGTPASDIYSLGCLFWACLTGHPPYSGPDVEVALAHVQAQIPQLVGADDVTNRINTVLRRALAKQPDRRYPSVEDFRGDLVALSRIDADDYRPQVPDGLGRGNTSTGTTMRRSEEPSGDRPSHTRRNLLAVLAVLALVSGGAAIAVTTLGGDAPGTGPTLGDGVSGDVDGDGLGDLTFRWYDYSDDIQPSRDFMVRSTGEGFADPEELPRPEGLGVIGDVDGDGRADRVGLDEDSGSESVVVQTILADGSEREVTWPAARHRGDGVPTLADLDGDGRDDLIISSDLDQDDEGGGTGTRIEVALSTADGFTEPETWHAEEAWDQYSTRVAAGDVDGDGADELLVRSTAQASAAASERGRSLATRLTLLKASDAELVPQGEPFELLADRALSGPVDLADVDGDGGAEVVAYIAGKVQARVLVLPIEDGQIQSGSEWFKRDGDGYLDLPQDRFLTDVDGDGRADLVTLPEWRERNFTLAVSLSQDGRFAEPEEWAEVRCRNDPCAESWSILRSGS